MKGSRKVESNFANITFILLIMQNMCVLINLIFIQRIHIVKDGYFQVRSFIKNKENLENKNKCIWCNFRQIKTPISFLHRQHGLIKN